MATPVSWSYGPWRTQNQPQQTNPYQDVSSTPVSWTNDDPSGSGRGGLGITGTAEYGPMTNRELGNMWGGTAARKGAGIGLGALFGSTPTAASLLGMAPQVGVTVASLMSSLLGGIRGIDAEFGIPTENDIRDIADFQGNMKSQKAARDAESTRASVNSTLNDLSGVNQPDWNGLSMSTAPSGPPSPEAQGYEGGYTDPNGGGGGGGQTSGGDRGSSDQSSDASGQGGAWARGGVRTFRGPSRPLVGEAGDETGIFVPESMKRPGNQGREPEVVAAMKMLLRSLRG